MDRTESSMAHRQLITLVGVVAVLLVAACATAPERELSKKAPTYAMLPNGHAPLNPDQLSPLYTPAAGGGTNAIRQLERKHGRALNILSLSGGGQNGAFGAGLLIGWR